LTINVSDLERRFYYFRRRRSAKALTTRFLSFERVFLAV